uniref:Immunoglobulin V-set domain-containing protein n=1 Tax=Gouania willdenowi TaxID=441366 RepID=A0A8C5DJ70_GOUWI
SMNSFTMILLGLLNCFLHLSGTQKPPFIIRKYGDSVNNEIKCKHNITNYYWYQQSHREPGLKRIGHVNYNDKEYEEGFQKDFIFTGDLSGDKAKNITLTISNLKTSEHSAVYYCAASYAQWQQMPSASYNNLHPSV